jgi:O-antigen chain-terminating methyltransferase
MNAIDQFIRWLKAIFRSARTRADVHASMARLDAVERAVADARHAMEAAKDALDLANADQATAMRALVAGEGERLDLAIADQATAMRALVAGGERLERALTDTSTHVKAHESRLDRLSPPLPPMPGDGRDWTGLIYAEAFRGAPAEIRERLKVHVAAVRQAVDRTGGAPVIDLGCGRGDWLALLRDLGINAFGVDESAESVSACKAIALDARQIDAIDALRAQPAGSIAAVTAFHIVEHMPFAAVATLMVEAHRALRPGGVMVIETPNCENVVVGANTFWLDPTHIRPYPLALLEFMASQAAFQEVRSMRLHPNLTMLESPQFQGIPTDLMGLLAGPQDVALVATRNET